MITRNKDLNREQLEEVLHNVQYAILVNKDIRLFIPNDLTTIHTISLKHNDNRRIHE